MGPLDGVTIIELAGLGALPFATLKLADMGADVIRVHPPGEVPELKPEHRDSEFDRGRRSITIDLKSPEGVEVLLRLVEKADAFARGVPPRGHRAPRHRPRRRRSPATRARLRPPHRLGPGRARSRRGPATRSTTRPSPVPSAPSASRPAAARPAAAGARRLRRRWHAHGLRRGVRPVRGPALGPGPGRRHRHGRRRDVALLGLLRHDPDAACTPAASARTCSTAARPSTTSTRPPTAKFVTVAPIEPRFYAQLLEKLGLDPADLPDQYDESRWPELRERLAEVFRTRTRDEWTELLEGTDVCFAPVLSFAEAPEHPHNKARGSFVDIDGSIRQLRPAPRLSRTPGRGAPDLRLPGRRHRGRAARDRLRRRRDRGAADAGTVAW